MGDVINLNAVFIKMQEEQNDHVYIDEHGDKWFEWQYTFDYNGKEYGYGIWTKSKEDAQGMLQAMSRGEIKGQIFWKNEETE